MNKQEKIASLKKISKMAEETISISRQNEIIATRLKVEVDSALVLLGAASGQTRKGKYELPDSTKISLRGRLTT